MKKTFHHGRLYSGLAVVMALALAVLSACGQGGGGGGSPGASAQTPASSNPPPAVSTNTAANPNAVWIAEGSALVKLDTANGGELFRKPVAEVLTPIARDAETGVVWALGVSTLYIIQPAGGIASVALALPAGPASQLATVPGSETAWIGAAANLYRVGKDGAILQQIALTGAIRDLLAESLHGFVWAATESGVTAYDGASGAEQLSLALPAGMSPQQIAFDDSLDAIWVASADALALYAADGTPQLSLAQPGVTHIVSDGNGSLWVAAAGQLLYLDQSGAQQFSLSLASVFTQGAALLHLVADPSDRSAWAATANQLVQIKPDSTVGHRRTAQGRLQALALFADIQPPVLNITSPAQGVYVNSLTPNIVVSLDEKGSGIDQGSVELRVDGVATSATCTFKTAEASCVPTAPLPEGLIKLKVAARDLAGNTGESDEISFTIDATAPQITVDAPVDGSLTNAATVTLSGRLSEAATLSVNGSPLPLDVNNAFTRDIALLEGANAFLLTATDFAGNHSERLIQVTRDSIAPTAVASDHITVSDIQNGTVTVTGAASAAEPGAQVAVTNTRTGAATTTTAAANGGFSLQLPVLSGDVLRILIRDAAGNESLATNVTAGGTAPPGGLPPDPATVAPLPDPTVATDVAAATAFLYTGANPIQTGVAPGTIEARRVAVLRGRVTDRDGSALPGVTISVLGHPEFGQTLTRADGAFDLAVNGGGQLTLRYEKNGLLAAQRAIVAPWRDYAWLPEVVMIPFDTAVTAVDLNVASMQTARGSPVTDADGARRATVLFPPGTTATMVLPDGTTRPLTTLNVRATEYTVGDSGPKAMPAPLPPSSGYTYAAELSVDEAVAAGASEVRFNQVLPVYVENFLDFPVGTAVPSGYYDRQKGQWIASQNGRVIKVLSITAGLADLDTDGDAAADDATKLTALGVTTAERARLAQLYTAGQTLWRVPIAHFTPWDFNFPYGPPSDGISPSGQNQNSPAVDEPCNQDGSIIGCENQSLGESVSITGTPWRLHYRSQRTPGRKDAYMLEIPLSGATIPASLSKIRVEVGIAGRLYRAAFAPAPNLTYTVTWDGKDGYGRPLQGSQPAVVTVSYDYVPQYFSVKSDFENSFAKAEAAGTAIMKGPSASTITLSKTWTEKVGAWDAHALGLGGWSLSVQHAYDPGGRVVHGGSGWRRSADGVPDVISLVAGKAFRSGDSLNPPSTFGDGLPAPDAPLAYPHGLALDHEGALYIASDEFCRVRKVGPDGVINGFAGYAGCGYGGDGGPAIQARFNTRLEIAVGPDGDVYIADTYNNRVRRVAPNGIITTVAGNGTAGFGGDGGPATQAQINTPFGVAVGPDGSIYIADTNNARVRRVAPNGIITTVAGNGVLDLAGLGGGDGGPATQVSLGYVEDVAVGLDGSIFLTSNGFIRRVGPDGIIATTLGGGNSYDDGIPATQAAPQTYNIAVGPDGSIYYLLGRNVRRIGTDGIITTVVGNGLSPLRDGGGLLSMGDGGPALQARFYHLNDIAVASDGTIYISDYIQGNFGWIIHQVRKVTPAFPGFAVGEMVFPSEDGSELYIFIGGRHLRTLDTLTGAVRYQFGYGTGGYLTSITDASGNVTTIERSGAVPTAIVAPGGQRTALIVSTDGWLLGANNPAAEAHTMSYSADGLMQRFIDPLGNIHRFTYDALGRLIKDEDPAGGSTSLARTEQRNGYIVTTTTALGRSRSYQVEQLSTGAVRRTVTAPSGAKTVTEIGTDGSQTVTYPDGTRITSTIGPDPRFGMQAPRLLKRVRTVPGGQTETTTSTRSANLADPSNLFSLQLLIDTVTVNGRTFARNYDAATRTMTDTSAEGRQTVFVLDAQGRVIRQELAGIAPITVTYDAQGRVIENRQGTQAWTYGYDARNRVVARTDAAGRSTGFLYDDADRITKKTLPSGAAYQFTYDANGNRTEVMLPSGARHALGYTPINLDASYTPPNNGSYLRTFNVDRQLTRTTLPAGRFTDQGYDAAGRVSGMSYPEAVTGFEYLANDLTDRVARITNTPVTGPAQDIAYSYNGSLISGMNASGVAPAQVSYSYDDDFFPTAMNLVSGTDTVQSALLWDKDGLASGFGPFTFTRGGPRGALSQISDAASTTSYGHDTLARIATRNHLVNGQTPYALQLSYDNVGRITGKTETANGITHAYAYAYDLNGQLIEITRDNVASERYAYDLNGNRTSRQLGSGSLETASYDDQDRLTQRGAVTYQFNADGFLAQRGGDTFQYNTRGQLLQATVGGQAITYGYDGLGRRVSRTDVSGTYQYLYGDPASHLVTAVRGPANELTTLFYDTAGLLIALERGGTRYYVATDQVGTPRVVSSSTGTLVKMVEYDSFGNVMADSNPAFGLPIGYAGGLADAATGLVHFGFRDYDPAAGRWTARDPVLFEGGQGNLYVYVGNNPINNRDPSGLFCVNVTAYDVIGGGVGFCITEDGASVCGEIGFGVGLSIGADGGGLEETGTQIVAEASYQVGPIEVGVGASLDSKGCFKITPKGQIGPITLEPGKVGLELDVEGAPKIGGGAEGGGAEAKIAAKGCVQGKF